LCDTHVHLRLLSSCTSRRWCHTSAPCVTPAAFKQQSAIHDAHHAIVHATTSPPQHGIMLAGPCHDATTTHTQAQTEWRERKRVRGGDLDGGEWDANDAGAGVVDGLDAVAAKRLCQAISLDDGADSSRAELLHLPVINHPCVSRTPAPACNHPCVSR
jgi:hypothetical protein